MKKMFNLLLIVTLLISIPLVVTANRYPESYLRPEDPDTANFGWTGFIETPEEVVPLLDKLKTAGWNSIRYQAVPEWALDYHKGYVSLLNFEVLDLLVKEAEKRGMTVYLLCAHCWKPSEFGGTGGSDNYIDGHEKEWIKLWLTLGKRYNNKNVVIDAWSEYSSIEGMERYQQLAQSLIDRLRMVRIKTEVHFNIWWNSPIFVLDDPIENYSVGRHQYGSMFDDYNPTVPIDFETACEESGINAQMDKYFTNEFETYFFQAAKKLGVKYVISEMGGSNTPDTSYGGRYSMSVGNVAYVMKLLQIAKENDVTCIMHRIGVYEDYDLYYQYAQEYFAETFR